MIVEAEQLYSLNSQNLGPAYPVSWFVRRRYILDILCKKCSKPFPKSWIPKILRFIKQDKLLTKLMQ